MVKGTFYIYGFNKAVSDLDWRHSAVLYTNYSGQALEKGKRCIFI